MMYHIGSMWRGIECREKGRMPMMLIKRMMIIMMNSNVTHGMSHSHKHQSCEDEIQVIMSGANH